MMLMMMMMMKVRRRKSGVEGRSRFFPGVNGTDGCRRMENNKKKKKEEEEEEECCFTVSDLSCSAAAATTTSPVIPPLSLTHTLPCSLAHSLSLAPPPFCLLDPPSPPSALTHSLSVHCHFSPSSSSLPHVPPCYVYTHTHTHTHTHCSTLNRLMGVSSWEKTEREREREGERGLYLMMQQSNETLSVQTERKTDVETVEWSYVHFTNCCLQKWTMQCVFYNFLMFL